MENKNYIKCLNKDGLIKILKQKNYTAEADILKPRNIDGLRFLELNELDLIRWGLNPKQKKLLLNCRNKISEELNQQTTKKPSVPQKPQFKSNSVNKIAQSLETKISFTSNENTSHKPRLHNFKSNCSGTTNESRVDDTLRGSNVYIDMTKKSVQRPQPVNVKSNHSRETPTSMVHSGITHNKPDIITRHPQFPSASKTNNIEDGRKNLQNVTDESDLQYETPKPIAKNQIFLNKSLDLLPEFRSTHTAPHSIPDRVESRPICSQKCPKQPKPPANEPSKFALNMNIAQYNEPSPIIQTKPFIMQKFVDEESDQTYEDPDQIQNNPPKQKFGIENYNDNYICPDPIQNPNKPLHVSPGLAGPPLPPRHLQQAPLLNESKKSTRFDINPIHNNAYLEDNFYEVEPTPEPSVYKGNPLKTNSEKGYDNFRLKTGLPPRAVNTDQNTGLKASPNKQGSIWNISEGNELPKPPLFEKRFEQADLNMVRKLSEDEEPETKFNPNDCPYYRNTDRKGARQLLERIPNLTDGAFLFRNSKEYFLVIMMYYQKHFYNVGIFRDSKDGKFYCKTDKEDQVTSFKTLTQFVEHYKTHPLIVISKEIELNIYLKEQLSPDLY